MDLAIPADRHKVITVVRVRTVPDKAITVREIPTMAARASQVMMAVRAAIRPERSAARPAGHPSQRTAKGKPSRTLGTRAPCKTRMEENKPGFSVRPYWYEPDIAR